MGAIHSSISLELLDFCLEQLPLKNFVATGDIEKSTVEAVAARFENLHLTTRYQELNSVESNSSVIHTNGWIHCGDFADLLNREKTEFSSTPTLFWLTGYWTHLGCDLVTHLETSLFRDLNAIQSLHPDSLILIDDARLYFCKPPKSEGLRDWPDLDDVMIKLRSISESHRMVVLNDIIIFYPSRIKEQFARYECENGVDWLDIVLESQITEIKFRGVVDKKIAIRKTGNHPRRKMEVSVVVPTLNCMDFLAEHLESIEPWISQVNEVVVVDSHSTDGTLEVLKKYLDHPNVKMFTRPRGLYQSWNFGIAQTTSRFVYISTVGDSIDGKHIELLEELAIKSDADVVISPPRFVDEQGQDVDNVRWPIQSILETHPEMDEFQFGSLAAFLFSAANIPCSILGSSASNMYRGEYLRNRPFPDDCSVIGDTAWSLCHSLDARFYVTRQIGSTFRLHSKTPDLSKSGYLHKVITRLLDEAEQMAVDLQKRGVTTPAEHQLILNLIHGDRTVSDAKERFTNARKQSVLPWFFSRDARRLRKLKKTAIEEFSRTKPYLVETLRSNR